MQKLIEFSMADEWK